MLVVVPFHPVLANSQGFETASGNIPGLPPGVRGVTVTEVGVGGSVVGESLVELHNGRVDMKIRDPLTTSTGKHDVSDLTSDVDIAAVSDILGRDGYVATGVTEHKYQTTVRGSTPVTVSEEVTYYTFANVATNTSRVVMVAQVVRPDGTLVGGRRIMVTPVVGEAGIVGSDELLVYEPQGGIFISGGGQVRGDGTDIEMGGPDARTPLLSHTGVAVATALLLGWPVLIISIIIIIGFMLLLVVWMYLHLLHYSEFLPYKTLVNVLRSPSLPL
jgi:hypothetical protein